MRRCVGDNSAAEADPAVGTCGFGRGRGPLGDVVLDCWLLAAADAAGGGGSWAGDGMVGSKNEKIKMAEAREFSFLMDW